MQRRNSRSTSIRSAAISVIETLESRQLLAAAAVPFRTAVPTVPLHNFGVRDVSLGKFDSGKKRVVSDTLFAGNRKDNWFFRLNQPSQVTFRLDSSSNGADLYLLRGNRLVRASTLSGNNPDMIIKSLPAGRYSVVVMGETNRKTSYTLAMSASSVAAPTGLEANVLGGNSIRLNWNDNASNEKGYRVDRYVRGKYRRMAVVPAGSTAAVIGNLNTNENYVFRVVAADGFSVAASTSLAYALTGSEESEGFYKVSNLSFLEDEGERGWTMNHQTLQILPEFDGKYVYASSWQDAVAQTVDGRAVVDRKDGSQAWHYFRNQGYFWTDTVGKIKDNSVGNDLTLDNSTKVIALEDSYGTIDEDYDDFVWTVDVEKLDYEPDLIAHRAGENFGDAVNEEDENSDDPQNFIVLTNDDTDEQLADNALDYDDETAVLDGTDDEMVKITLNSLYQAGGVAFANGKLALTASNDASVQFYDKDGYKLSPEDLTLDLADPDGYLADILTEDVDVWVEGLSTDADLALTYAFGGDESYQELANDSVHMLIADWNWVGDAAGSDDLPYLTTVTKQFLMGTGVDLEVDADVPSEAKFKVEVDGLDASIVDSLTLVSDSANDETDVELESSGDAVASRWAVAYHAADNDVISESDKSTIRANLGIEVIHNQSVTGDLAANKDQYLRDRKALQLDIEYVGGTDKNDGTKEDLQTLDYPYYMKGYMLKLTATNAPANAQVTWTITKGGQNAGGFRAGGAWTDYTAPLQQVPTSKTIYWLSDVQGQITDVYQITASWQGLPKPLTWKIQSRLLDPTNAKMSGGMNEDADMAQRLMIQAHGMDKGRVKYNIGKYETYNVNAGAYYTATRGGGARRWSPIASEVGNFSKFAMNGQDDPTLTLQTLTGMWSEVVKMAAAPNANGVTATHAQYGNWIAAAVNQTGIAAPAGLVDNANNAVTISDVLDALVKKESGVAQRHSYDLAAPLGWVNVSIGENNSTTGDPANELHTYTDFGVGFMKIQPYNANGLNLYKPDENIMRGTQMFKDALTGAGNPGGTAAEKVFFAYVKYNTGGYQGNTPADVPKKYRDRANTFLEYMNIDPLGNPPPTP